MPRSHPRMRISSRQKPISRDMAVIRYWRRAITPPSRWHGCRRSAGSNTATLHITLESRRDPSVLDLDEDPTVPGRVRYLRIIILQYLPGPAYIFPRCARPFSRSSTMTGASQSPDPDQIARLQYLTKASLWHRQSPISNLGEPPAHIVGQGG